MRMRKGFCRFFALLTAVSMMTGSLSAATLADEPDFDAEVIVEAAADGEDTEAPSVPGAAEELVSEENIDTYLIEEDVSSPAEQEPLYEEGSAPVQEDEPILEQDDGTASFIPNDLVEEAEEIQDEQIPDEELPDDELPSEEAEGDEPVIEDLESDELSGEAAESELTDEDLEALLAESVPEEGFTEESEEMFLAGADSGTVADGKINWAVSTAGDKKTLTFTLVNASNPAAIPDYSSLTDRPWNEHCSSVTDIVIGDNVTGIGQRNFSGFSKLSQVKIPATGCVSIGAQAFWNCQSLKEIVIPSGVTSIAAGAFEGDSSLVIKGSFGSKAEEFAVQYSYRFVPISVTNLSGAVVTITPTEYVYDGTPKQPAVVVKYSKITLVNGLDYSLNYGDSVNAGLKTVTITGIGNYNGSKTAQYTIKTVSIKSAAITGIKKKGYTGRAITQSPKVVVNGRTLVEGTDYVLTYKNNKKQPKKQKKKYVKATVTITGKGNYTGSVSKKFYIVRSKIKKSNVSDISSKVYTGKALYPKVKVKVGGVKLKKDRDYTINYYNNKDYGTATVVIKGKGNYKGTVKKYFKIRKVSIADAKISGVKTKTYTGKSIYLDLTLTVNKRTLREGTDYSVQYSNNVYAGTATVVIKGKNNYKGKRVENFTIEKASMRNVKVTGIKDMPYTGSAVKQSPTLTLNGVTLEENRDYTISYQNNVNIGTATIIFTGKGSMTGAVSANFKIVQYKISDAKISGISDKEYTGDAVTQKISVQYGDKTLKSGRDYSVSYSNNVSVGYATVTITGMNGYSGSVTYGFNINPKSAPLTSVNLVVKRLTIQWNPQSNIDGYWLQYGTDKTFNTYIKNLNLSSDRSQYIANVPTANTRYYVRIRTYKDVDGKRYYSSWRDNLTNEERNS